jgi:hypothetical protein
MSVASYAALIAQAAAPFTRLTVRTAASPNASPIGYGNPTTVNGSTAIAAAGVLTAASLGSLTGGSVAPLIDPTISRLTTAARLTRFLAGGNGVGSGVAAALVPPGAMLIDRLVHTGPLTIDPTTNTSALFPTAPLTRYTDGKGVFAQMRISASVPGGTVFTLSYTNSDGVAGRTATAPIISSPQEIAGAGSLLHFGLQAGDAGIRSVESYSLTGGTVGNVSQHWLTLFRILCVFPHPNRLCTPQNYLPMIATTIEPNAHLAIVYPYVLQPVSLDMQIDMDLSLD